MTTPREVRREALLAVSRNLGCPHCGEPIEVLESTARCSRGHSFDLARAGYLNLASGGTTGDSAEMVAARDAFLGGGHFAPIAAAITIGHRLTVELGGGTGYYTAAALERAATGRGICLELSVPALRKAAGAHPRLAAVGADVWKGLPLRDNSVETVLSVFGPRNPGEIARVLTTGGRFTVITPTSGHLGELVGPLGMISVDARKEQRLEAAFGIPDETELISYRIDLPAADVSAVVAMGPSRRHMTADELAARVRALGERAEVTVSARISTYVKR